MKPAFSGIAGYGEVKGGDFMISAIELIKFQVKNARELFEGTVADITQEQLEKVPGGKAHPLGATYAHLIFSEDAIMQGMVQGKAPLFATTWKDKTGASEPMPAMDEKWSEANDAWGKSVKINLAELREYAKAVYAATDDYLATLKDEDIEKEIDLGSWGKKSFTDFMTGFIIGHTFSLAGEISVLKGVQGAKGYPF
jgi:hypothetical protein